MIFILTNLNEIYFLYPTYCETEGIIYFCFMQIIKKITIILYFSRPYNDSLKNN